MGRRVTQAGVSPLATLPLALAQHVFLVLDVRERAQASCVCRSWRDVLAAPALWSRLDLSRLWSADDDALSDGLLLAASARARGRLSFLDVTGGLNFSPHVLLAVLAANAEHLRELRVFQLSAMPRASSNPTFEEILSAAPRLNVLDAEVECDVHKALVWLRAGPLRCSSLKVYFQDTTQRHWRRGRTCSAELVREFATLLGGAAAQHALATLTIYGADTSDADVLNALVDVALSQRAPRLFFENCTGPAAAPLARLLNGGAVKQLSWAQTVQKDPSGRLVSSPTTQFLDADGAALVADALHANTAL